MSTTEESQNEGTWTIMVEGGTALWSNIQAAVRDAMRDRKADSPGHQALKRLYEGKAEFKGRMPGLIPERPSGDRQAPHWDQANQGCLLVHCDDLSEIAGLLPPQVEMRVQSILRSVKTTDPGNLKRPGFMVALNQGDGTYDMNWNDLEAVSVALAERGQLIPPLERPVESADREVVSEAERTAPDRYREAQEAREAAAGVAQTPEGRKAATYVELGDLKTIARDKGWDLAFEWIVGHQAADEPEMFSDDHEAAQLAAFRRTVTPSFERGTVDEARTRAGRRVLAELMFHFEEELQQVPMGVALHASMEIVRTVLDEDHDPLRTSELQSGDSAA
jgi:hypothetical protein